MSEEQFKGPTWRYNPKTGEGRVFTDVNDVPDGWVDSLDGLTDDAVKNDGMTRKDITTALDAGGIKYAAKAKTDDLYTLLRERVMQALDEHKIKHDDNATLPELLALLS